MISFGAELAFNFSSLSVSLYLSFCLSSLSLSVSLLCLSLLCLSSLSAALSFPSSVPPSPALLSLRDSRLLPLLKTTARKTPPRAITVTSRDPDTNVYINSYCVCRESNRESVSCSNAGAWIKRGKNGAPFLLISLLWNGPGYLQGVDTCVVQYSGYQREN